MARVKPAKGASKGEIEPQRERFTVRVLGVATPPKDERERTLRVARRTVDELAEWVKELESNDLPPDRIARLSRALADVSLTIIRASTKEVHGSDAIYLRYKFFKNLEAIANLKNDWTPEFRARNAIGSYCNVYDPEREPLLLKNLKLIVQGVEACRNRGGRKAIVDDNGNRSGKARGRIAKYNKEEFLTTMCEPLGFPPGSWARIASGRAPSRAKKSTGVRR
jgi:chorismate mutase